MRRSDVHWTLNPVRAGLLSAVVLACISILGVRELVGQRQTVGWWVPLFAAIVGVLTGIEHGKLLISNIRERSAKLNELRASWLTALFLRVKLSPTARRMHRRFFGRMIASWVLLSCLGSFLYFTGRSEYGGLLWAPYSLCWLNTAYIVCLKWYLSLPP